MEKGTKKEGVDWTYLELGELDHLVVLVLEGKLGGDVAHLAFYGGVGWVRGYVTRQ